MDFVSSADKLNKSTKNLKTKNKIKRANLQINQNLMAKLIKQENSSQEE